LKAALSIGLGAGVLPLAKASEPLIKIVVGFPPGGTTDVVARLLAAEMSNRLGRNVIVENRPGASGNIAAQVVAKSTADGNTLLLVPSSHATNASLYKELPFDTQRDFSAIGMAASTPYVLVVHPDLPAKNIAEFISMLKAKPGQYMYATASPGTGQHLAAELFKSMASVDMAQVPYKGSSAAFPDLVAGRTPIMFDNVALMVPHIKAGTLRPLGITSTARSPLLPDVPSISETLPGYEVLGWFALLGPSGMKPETVKMLNDGLNAAIASAGFKKAIADLGGEVMSGTPASADDYIHNEISRWADVIHKAHISLS